ncbi:UNVERIFIED_CONTAM: hypothetical protein Sradi_4001600 [Sesamum radiatum]|uniref:Aminotransferase-like plant mobile domain-containing protein n=1 Tax=Sesamum radiatum TaxID=300843 RepID=A0AAW2PH33_SESRA
MEDIEGGVSNWGVAVLAYLYRELCTASQRRKVNIGGAMQLLQIWAWSRIITIAPIPSTINTELRPTIIDEENILPHPPYAARWSYHISQTHAAHNVVRIIRNTFDQMKQNEAERVGQMIIDYNNAPTDYPSVRQLMASHHQTHQEIMNFLETRYPPVYSGATLYNSGNEAGPSNARNEAGPSTQHTPANMAYPSNSDASNLPFVEDEYAINPVLRRHYGISPVPFEHLDSPAQNTDQRQEQPARRNRRRPRCGTGGHY